MEHVPSDPRLIAQLDFRPVPAAKRQSPGRVKSIPARFYVDKYIEHQEAAAFLESQQALHGEGSKTLVRALLHYRDTVIRPLEASRRAGGRRASGRRDALSPELVVAQLAFRPVPADQRRTPGRVRHASARLYIDKWQEHAEAFEFLQAQQELHGEGLKTLIRALLHYRDSVIRPLEASASSVHDSRPQLSLDLTGV